MITEARHSGFLASENERRKTDIHLLYPDVIIDSLSFTDILIILGEAIRCLEFRIHSNVREADERLLIRKRDWFERVYADMQEAEDTFDGRCSIGTEHRLALDYACQELKEYMEDIDMLYSRITQALSVM